MPHTKILSKPSGTKSLLDKLKLAIDEAKIVKKIVSLSDDFRLIENMPEQAERVQLLKEDISNLEGRLSDVRERASYQVSS